MNLSDFEAIAEPTTIDAKESDWETSLDGLFRDLFGVFADVLLKQKFEEEIDAQRELIEAGNYCSAIIRQAAFVETLLQFSIILKIETYNERALSNQEQDAFDRMGNEPKVYMANALGLLSDSEYEAYTKLMGKRNDVAHNWWVMFSEEENEHFERVAELVLETLESSFEDADFS